VQGVIAQFDAPGTAVAIVKDGQVLLRRGYGVRRTGATAAVDEHTLFYTASVTKAFTVTALGIAADEGRIRIDDPVVKYLPEFKLADPALTAALTIRDLMSHRTGLPRADMLMVSGLSNDLMLGRLAALGSVAPIRTRFTYNNQMYLALGLLLERVTGSAWSDFVEARLLKPVGFADGNARGLGHWPSAAPTASPHARGPGGVQPIDLVARAPYGAGGINASAADLAAWTLFHLTGAAGGAKIVTPNVIAAEHAPNVLMPTNATMPSAVIGGYGLGWFVHDYFGHKIVQHGGNGEGWSALVWMAPQQRLGVAVLTNMHNSAVPYALAYSVADRLLERPPRDWVKEYKTLEARMGPPALASPGTALEAPGAAAAGEYEHPVYGRARLSTEKDRLVFSYGTLSGAIDGTTVTWRRSDMAAVLGSSRLSISGATLVLEAAGERIEFARLR
jgi:CubicO group peptidase (beta-lactamase class C family)